ncbi:MAG: drug/metabolite transporter (DMT)-like permease [Verrucomicrobiales bacterium]
MASRSVLLQVIVCALLWGTAFPLIKVAYADWPERTLALCLFFAGIRFTIAGAGILMVCDDLWSRLRSANLRLLIALTLTQTCLQYLCFYAGMSVSSGVLGALLVGCGSFWWVLLAPLLLKTPTPLPCDWWTLFVSSIGITLAVYAPGAGSGQVWLGALCFLLASFFGAVGLVIMKPLGAALDAKTATGISLFAGGLLLLAAGASAANTFASSMTPRLAGITLALALVSAVSFCIWNRLAHTHSVNVLANYRFLIPLSGAVQASLFISGEAPGPGIIIGGTLILGSLYWLNRPKAPISP